MKIILILTIIRLYSEIGETEDLSLEIEKEREREFVNARKCIRQFDLRQKMTNERSTKLFAHTARFESRYVTKDHSVCDLRLITFLESLSKRLGKRTCEEEKDIVGNGGSWKERREREKKRWQRRSSLTLSSFSSLFLITVVFVHKGCLISRIGRTNQ